MKHKTRDGREIPLREMDRKHLTNTILKHLSMMDKGIKVKRGGGYDPSDFWYEEDTVKGIEYLQHVGFKHYIKEYTRRGLHHPKIQLVDILFKIL